MPQIIEKNKKIIVKKENVSNSSDFTFIDLFAGIGGFHLAMHSIGGKCVFASEIDKFARQTYVANYQKWEKDLFDQSDSIKKFNSDIRDKNLNYNDIPNFDILCGGFPCQAFSHAGLKKGFADTRGTLFFNIEQIILSKINGSVDNKDIKIPKILFLENVKGLLGHDKKRTFETICNTLDSLGYNFSTKILNSKNFGVPQNRERLFFVAWNKELINVEQFKFPVGITEFGKNVFDQEELNEKVKKVKVGDILLTDDELAELEKREGVSYTISEKLWAGHQRRRKEHKEKGNGFGYSLFDRNSPYTSTISARYYKDGSEILISQGPQKRPRKLHPLEAAMLQGYLTRNDLSKKNKFIIPVSNAQAYKQFGNSVSVPVIKAIALEIKNQLLNNAKRLK